MPFAATRRRTPSIARRLSWGGAIWAKKAFADLVLERPNDKISFLTVVQADCELSTPPDVRKELAELLGQNKNSLAGAAIAFEGEGFRMTVVRSVITAINIASRTRFPNAVFSNTGAALGWLHRHSSNPNSSIRVHQLISAWTGFASCDWQAFRADLDTCPACGRRCAGYHPMTVAASGPERALDLTVSRVASVDLTHVRGFLASAEALDQANLRA